MISITILLWIAEAGHVGGYTESLRRSNPIDFEESTHENSKHHADVVEYEEDTNPGGGPGNN